MNIANSIANLSCFESLREELIEKGCIDMLHDIASSHQTIEQHEPSTTTTTTTTTTNNNNNNINNNVNNHEVAPGLLSQV